MAAALPPGLIARWRFNGDAVDAIAGRNGTVFGATFTSGRYGNQQALSFDGVNDYVLVAHNAALKPTTGLMLSALVYVSALGAARFIGCAQTTGWRLGSNDGTNIDFLVFLDGAGFGASYSLAEVAAGWHVITAATDRRYCKLYLDGELAVTTDTGSTKTAISYTFNNGIIIGAEVDATTNPATPYFNGKLLEVMLGDTAPTDAEARNLYEYLTQYLIDAPLTTIAPALFAPYTSPWEENIPLTTVFPQSLAPRDAVVVDVDSTSVPIQIFAPGQYLQDSIPLTALGLQLFIPNNYTIFPDVITATRVYQIRLEKTGLDPLILPCTNVSVRSSIEGRQSSITATIPELTDIDAIAARASGGQLVFAGGYLLAGVRRLNDILTLPFTDVKPDEGTTNKSLTLTAKGPSPLALGKSVTVASIEYQSINGLKRLIRLPVNVNLLPGDSVVTGSATWTAGEIVYALGEGGESMTVTEA